MENAIRARRVHFFLFFWSKSDLGLSWKHLRDILGCLGKIIGSSWAPKTPVLAPKTPPRWAQEPQQNKTMTRRSRETDPRRGTPSGGARENRWFYSWVPFFAAKLRLCWGIWLHFATQFQLKRARFFSPERRQYWRFLNDRSQVKRGGGHAA